MLKKVLIATLFVSLISLSVQRCGFDIEKHKSLEIGKVNLWEESGRFLQATTWTPIRIYLDYSTLNSQTNVVTQSVIDNIKTVMNSVSTTLSSLINVKASSSNLAFPSCSNTFTLKISNAVKSGVAADLVIFPYVDTSFTAGVEAAASYCLQDSVTNRPVAGYVGFSPQISFAKKNSVYYNSLLVLHEINHVMSFHSELFQNFVDANNNPIPFSKVVINKTVNGVARQMLATPKVVAAAQKYFGCSTMAGVELENQGGEGTAGSHWEERIMAGDYMIGQSYAENVISPMTLALMEDSGWYTVNYYDGGLFRFGKNQGCDFVNTKCVVNGQTKFPNEYNVVADAPACYAGRTAKGVSSLQSGISVDTAYQYFTDKTKGGQTNADFCPIASESSVDGYYFGTTCIYGTSTFPASMGEVIGSNSNCFISTLTPQNDNSVAGYKGNNQAICYPITCNAATTTYTVTVGSQSVQCPSQGGSVTVSGFNGSLNCPSYNLLCTRSVPCGDTLDCVAKKSLELGAAVLPSTTPVTPSTTPTDSGSTTPSSGATSNSLPSSSSSSSAVAIATSFATLTLALLL